jgi:hypothetical protein
MMQGKSLSEWRKSNQGEDMPDKGMDGCTKSLYMNRVH